MGARGPKRKDAETYKLRGTFRPSVHGSATQIGDPDDYIPQTPEWFEPGTWAQTLWDDRVTEYRRRGQRIKGFEAELAKFCMLSDQIIQTFRLGITPPASLLAADARYATAFYDTPASAIQASVDKSKGPENPFRELAR